jgi:hypothetical protein
MDQSSTEPKTQYGVFKLITGQEIIAEWVEAPTAFMLTAVRAIIPRQINQRIDLGLGFWFLSAPDDVFIIAKDKIIAYTEQLDQDLINAYIKNVTGLEIANTLPNNGNLITT